MEYQVRAHFEWNIHRPDLKGDQIDGKHHTVAKRMLDRGGRQDIFLGTRDCQGYVEACEIGSGEGAYDDAGQLAFGVMFHGFDYPDETGNDKLHARFWRPTMLDGKIQFDRPDSDSMIRKFVRPMNVKQFGPGKNLLSVTQEELQMGDSL